MADLGRRGHCLVLNHWCFDSPVVGGSSTLAVSLEMLDSDEKDLLGLPVTVRKVFVIGPDKKIKLTLTYPPAYAPHIPSITDSCEPLSLPLHLP